MLRPSGTLLFLAPSAILQRLFQLPPLQQQEEVSSERSVLQELPKPKNSEIVPSLELQKLTDLILRVRKSGLVGEVDQEQLDSIVQTQKEDLLNRISDYLDFNPDQPTSIGDGAKVQSEEQKLQARAEKVKTRRDLLDEIIQLELSKNDSSFKFSRKSVKRWEDLLSLDVNASTLKDNFKSITLKIDGLFKKLRPMAVLQNQFIDTVRDNPEQRDTESLRKFQIEYNNVARENRTMFERIFGRSEDLNMEAIFQALPQTKVEKKKN